MIVRPDDTLIVCIDGRTTNEQAAVIQSELAHRLPRLADIIVLPAHSIAVFRDEYETEPT